MARLIIAILCLTMLAAGCNKASVAKSVVVAEADTRPVAQAVTADSAETRYLTFQVMTGLPGYVGPQPAPGHYAPSKAQLEEFVHSVVRAIGITGDARHKLGFAVGPLCFDMSDEETRQFIRDAMWPSPSTLTIPSPGATATIS